jgi:hypothetical protein
MIQYDTNGVTLYYIDANGVKISASPTDGVKYTNMDTIMQAQIAAASANTQAVANYNNLLQAAQTSADAGRPATAPPKPLETVVSDTGVTTYVPFNPPLADLVPLDVTAPSSGTIAEPTVDTQAIMYAMITAIYRKMFPSS